MHVLSRFVLLLAIAAAFHVGWAQEQTSRAQPAEGQERVLVLQDGGVLKGRIAREGDRYVVTRAGGEMEVAASRVLFVSSSLEEAYRDRRRQLARPTAEAHLALAEWCLRYDLLAPARRELTEARALDARHPRLAVLERRLAYASRQQQATPVVARSAAHPPAPAPAESTTPRQTAAPEAPDVSPRVVERFTRKVQPVLVNNCTTSGCHRPGGTQPFQLNRALLHGLANRRTTMSNLAAALALVDRERPQLSPLLTVPRRAHGGMEHPIIGPREEQAFIHLEQWVALVAQADSSQSLAPASPEAESDLRAAREMPEGDESAAGQLLTTGESEPARREFVADPGTAGVVPANHVEVAPAPAIQRLRFGARVEKWHPRDPFDPEIFNRQTLAKRQEAGAAN